MIWSELRFSALERQHDRNLRAFDQVLTQYELLSQAVQDLSKKNKTDNEIKAVINPKGDTLFIVGTRTTTSLDSARNTKKNIVPEVQSPSKPKQIVEKEESTPTKQESALETDRQEPLDVWTTMDLSPLTEDELMEFFAGKKEAKKILIASKSGKRNEFALGYHLIDQYALTLFPTRTRKYIRERSDLYVEMGFQNSEVLLFPGQSFHAITLQRYDQLSEALIAYDSTKAANPGLGLKILRVTE